MIFATFGTNPYPFNRLMDALVKLAKKAKYEVIAQTGVTKCDCDEISCIDYMQHEDVIKNMENAEVIVTQGGFGSLKEAIASGRPVLVVPRRPELGESKDEQKEIVDELVKLGLVVEVSDVNYLEDYIEKADIKRDNVDYSSDIPKIIIEYINSLA